LTPASRRTVSTRGCRSWTPCLARHTRASDEHGIIELDGPGTVTLGQKLRLIPGHCDPTVNLHEWFVCIRGDRVEDIWPIAARGAFY